MNKIICGLLLGLFLVAIGGFKEVHADAVGEIKFLKFSADCYEDWYRTACDPYFYFCLDKPRTSSSLAPCYYGYTDESDYFLNTNYIDFSTMTDIKGIKNPWIINIPVLNDNSGLLVSYVQDSDTLDDDDMVLWNTSVSITVYPSKAAAVWTTIELKKDSYVLTLQYRFYCQANFYGETCSNYCLADQSGFYSCDPVTGKKTCKKGWTGVDCTVDVNECLLGTCLRGTCENTPGTYVCSCPQGYTGKNCEAKRNPCESLPCQNGMKCTQSSDHSTYVCDCRPPTTGFNCETIIYEKK